VCLLEVSNASSAVELTLSASFLFLEWKMIVSFPAFPVLRSCLDFNLTGLKEKVFAIACQLS